jgi:hypothetical protein
MIAIDPRLDTSALPTISPRCSTAARRRGSGQEPPPGRTPSKSPLSYIGKNGRGNRLVQDNSTFAPAIY